AAGYVQASVNGAAYSTANVAASGQTITFTAAAGLDAGDTILVRYGDKSGGGPGAVATTASGAANLSVQEKSTSGGTLTSLGAGSPSVTVTAAALDHLVFVAAGSQTDGVAFSGTNTLTAKDQYENTVTSFDASTDNVTITTSLSGAVGGIHGANGHLLNQAADFTNGGANLTGLGITYTGTVGTGTFTATSADGKTGTSGSVTIGVGAANAAQSTVVASPTAVPADDSTTATITVTLI